MFEGVLTALVTPFREGAVDERALEALVERQIAGGVDHPAAAVTGGPGFGDHAVEAGTGSHAHGARRAKKSDRHLCGDAQMTFAFIEQHASTWPVNVMCRHRICALAGRRFRPGTTDSRHDLPIVLNLLAERFVAHAPNRIWLAGITYSATGEGWLYLAAVLNLATRKIVGWAMRTELPLASLMMAAQRQRPGPSLICYSDRGSQYAARAYGDYLAVIDAMPSMSRTANCYDNAPMESFFHTLKVELAHQCRWATQADARHALLGYIEGYYNQHRMHSALGYLTPEPAEQRMIG